MRRTALITLSTAGGIVLLLALKPHQSGQPVLAAHQPSVTPSRHPSSQGTSEGTFTGDAINTQYGPVQLAVTVSKGRLTAVKVLQVPHESARDKEITAYAVPRLTQEAMGARSAHIDAVSGASYTSEGYIQSLQSALDQAGV